VDSGWTWSGYHSAEDIAKTLTMSKLATEIVISMGELRNIPAGYLRNLSVDKVYRAQDRRRDVPPDERDVIMLVSPEKWANIEHEMARLNRVIVAYRNVCAAAGISAGVEESAKAESGTG
jgi:hypothetical protein